MISAVLLGALHAVVSIKFKADQIISGTVINILAIGVTGYMYRQFLAENLPGRAGHLPDHAAAGALADPDRRPDPVRAETARLTSC